MAAPARFIVSLGGRCVIFRYLSNSGSMISKCWLISKLACGCCNSKSVAKECSFINACCISSPNKNRPRAIISFTAPGCSSFPNCIASLAILRTSRKTWNRLSNKSRTSFDTMLFLPFDYFLRSPEFDHLKVVSAGGLARLKKKQPFRRPLSVDARVKPGHDVQRVITNTPSCSHTYRTSCRCRCAPE
jgi:hypothetical protein